VDTSIETTIFSTCTHIFTPNAANWKYLNLVAGSDATVGSTASANLAGTITGAGLVCFQTGSGGTFDFDKFRTCQVVGAAGRETIFFGRGMEAPFCVDLFPIRAFTVHIPYCNGVGEDHEDHEDHIKESERSQVADLDRFVHRVAGPGQLEWSDGRAWRGTGAQFCQPA
jgi:hypothetical protein